MNFGPFWVRNSSVQSVPAGMYGMALLLTIFFSAGLTDCNFCAHFFSFFFGPDCTDCNSVGHFFAPFSMTDGTDCNSVDNNEIFCSFFLDGMCQEMGSSRPRFSGWAAGCRHIPRKKRRPHDGMKRIWCPIPGPKG